MNENKQELLELYKLHATLADNVTKNRGNANSVYVSLLSAALFFYVRLINLFETHPLHIHRPDVANLLIIGGALLAHSLHLHGCLLSIITESSTKQNLNV